MESRPTWADVREQCELMRDLARQSAEEQAELLQMARERCAMLEELIEIINLKLQHGDTDDDGDDEPWRESLRPDRDDE